MIEGVTDEIIFETAWRRLFGVDANRPFEILSAFSCTTHGRLMRSDEFYQDNHERIIFALYDWDDACNEWNMNHSQVVQDNVSRCFTKKRNRVDGYNLMLPVFEEHSCYGQVVNAATDLLL
ncbi:MAG: hypothetical protein ABGX10_02105 [Paracoccus sp. (in: a-proteobacteria)]|uniref:hypothetical protein n=1 Tax=Paracoccus sp. TaxID=267 RepID=UPI003241E9FB